MIVLPYTIKVGRTVGIGRTRYILYVVSSLRIACAGIARVPSGHILIGFDESQLIGRRNGDRDIGVTLITLISNRRMIHNRATGAVHHIKLQDVVIIINRLIITRRTSATARATVMPFITFFPITVPLLVILISETSCVIRIIRVGQVSISTSGCRRIITISTSTTTFSSCMVP